MATDAEATARIRRRLSGTGRRDEEADEMKNTLSDLNNYLFESIERLNDDNLSEEGLEREIKRSKAVREVASTIIANGTLALQAKKHFDEYGIAHDDNIPLLGTGKE